MPFEEAKRASRRSARTHGIGARAAARQYPHRPECADPRIRGAPHQALDACLSGAKASSRCCRCTMRWTARCRRVSRANWSLAWAAKPWTLEVPMRVDLKFGRSWGDAKHSWTELHDGTAPLTTSDHRNSTEVVVETPSAQLPNENEPEETHPPNAPAKKNRNHRHKSHCAI